MDLTRFKRLNLFRRPTPLEELARLQQAIGCKPRIFLKRDDLTDSRGSAATRTGNWISLWQMRWPRVQTIITLGGVQSNHCRQTLAVATSWGLNATLILQG